MISVGTVTANPDRRITNGTRGFSGFGQVTGKETGNVVGTDVARELYAR